MHIQQLQADQPYLSEIVRLWNDNAQETADCSLSEEEVEAIGQQLADYVQSPYGMVHIAVDDEQKLVGYGLASLKKDMLTEDYIGQVDELYVIPAYRKQKAGQAIFHSLKSWLENQNVVAIQVFVDVDNASAQAFWERTGFSKEFYVMSEEE